MSRKRNVVPPKDATYAGSISFLPSVNQHTTHPVFHTNQLNETYARDQYSKLGLLVMSALAHCWLGRG